MRFLIIKWVQNQRHILASRASFKSAERERDRNFPGCDVVAFKTQSDKKSG